MYLGSSETLSPAVSRGVPGSDANLKESLTAAHALLWESKRYKVAGGRAVTCSLMLWVSVLPFLSRYVEVLTQPHRT